MPTNSVVENGLHRNANVLKIIFCFRGVCMEQIPQTSHTYYNVNRFPYQYLISIQQFSLIIDFGRFMFFFLNICVLWMSSLSFCHALTHFKGDQSSSKNADSSYNSILSYISSCYHICWLWSGKWSVGALTHRSINVGLVLLPSIKWGKKYSANGYKSHHGH